MNYNKEHYHDPTPAKAFSEIHKEEIRHANKLLLLIDEMCEKCGFRLLKCSIECKLSHRHYGGLK